MLQAGLRLEQAPPIWVPFRFFLTAPIFLVLIAGVLLWRGPEVLESRLSPAALAVTHLFTLGFMSMVMVGAVMQLLPVLAGAPIARPRAVAAVTHLGLGFGTLSLAAGFLFGAPWLLDTGTVTLGSGFAVFIAAVATALWRSSAKDRTKGMFWLPLLCLVVTVALGVTLGSSLGLGMALTNVSIRHLHPGWGLLGWAGLLAIGVAYRVVPMFQITPKYPAPMMKCLAAAIFLVLTLWSVTQWVGEGTWAPFAIACALALAAGYVGFAATTIVLQQRRRRRQPDVTLNFWKVGMACLIAANVIWALRVASPAALPEAVDVLIGLLALLGCAGSIINGMLCKIMPFLAWFHLQSMTGAGRLVPNMKTMLRHADQRLQFGTHVAALALVLAAVAWPSVLVYPAALALCASGALLEVNLLKVLRYLRKPVPSSLGSGSSQRQSSPTTEILMQRK